MTAIDLSDPSRLDVSFPTLVFLQSIGARFSPLFAELNPRCAELVLRATRAGIESVDFLEQPDSDRLRMMRFELLLATGVPLPLPLHHFYEYNKESEFHSVRLRSICSSFYLLSLLVLV